MIKIRNAKSADRKQYLIIQKEAFPTSDSRREGKFFDLKFKKGYILVAEKDGDYLGHLAFEDYSITPPFAKSIWLQEFAVKKNERSKGYGKKLLNAAAEYCKKKKIPVIYIPTSDYPNNRAIKLYKRLGFKLLGTLADVVPSKEYPYPQVFYGIKVSDWK
ncbi:GNAT family N-acetyltransferase [Candidatus Woesearchaeota archaeon]|jgi:GNAT superfamily N-acetyltransferase|nr:GNAT family N-acetyltransferase [Candidatus Woesearchaeota archaeon]MBT7402216.1 GNAT family N-acetyltransferase [Candidatus Woesearchaeota archaeon]